MTQLVTLTRSTEGSRSNDCNCILFTYTRSPFLTCSLQLSLLHVQGKLARLCWARSGRHPPNPRPSWITFFASPIAIAISIPIQSLVKQKLPSVRMRHAHDMTAAEHYLNCIAAAVVPCQVLQLVCEDMSPTPPHMYISLILVHCGWHVLYMHMCTCAYVHACTYDACAAAVTGR